MRGARPRNPTSHPTAPHSWIRSESPRPHAPRGACRCPMRGRRVVEGENRRGSGSERWGVAPPPTPAALLRRRKARQRHVGGRGRGRGGRGGGGRRACRLRTWPACPQLPQLPPLPQLLLSLPLEPTLHLCHIFHAALQGKKEGVIVFLRRARPHRAPRAPRTGSHLSYVAPFRRPSGGADAHSATE